MNSIKNLKSPQNLIIIVAALGYFVDIYDLILFNVVKKSSLMALGYAGEELNNKGMFLFNMQMIGMLAGGILWGVLGDKKGRLKVLFGSIIMYSLANILNAFVTDINSYAVIRFIAGVGLAGELGAGITLVAETMNKEKRGYGTMIIVTFGALGAVLAALVADKFEWQIAYLVGGGLGLALLVLRIGTLESQMFNEMKDTNIKKGQFHHLFSDKKRFFKYLNCIMIGFPIWFTIGILIALSEMFATHMGVTGKVSVGTAIMFAYIGLSAGDLVSGFLSQYFRSRKKIVIVYILFTAVLLFLFLFSHNISVIYFNTLCFLLGFAAGYWAIFVTIASEQFGTNFRSTVTTTVPNFVRGAVAPITLGFQFLVPGTGIVYGALIIGMACIILAFISVLSIKETFGKDLNYIEIF